MGKIKGPPQGPDMGSVLLKCPKLRWVLGCTPPRQSIPTNPPGKAECAKRCQDRSFLVGDEETLDHQDVRSGNAYRAAPRSEGAKTTRLVGLGQEGPQAQQIYTTGQQALYTLQAQRPSTYHPNWWGDIKRPPEMTCNVPTVRLHYQGITRRAHPRQTEPQQLSPTPDLQLDCC